jgi:hypothetical protein
MYDFHIEVTAGTLSFIHQDFDRLLVEGFYADNEELAQLINYRIQQRTAMRTGALRQDELYEVNRNPSNPDLVTFYLGEEHQLAEWGRTYGRFIEGPTLGNSSPTISHPSHMYARIETDDIDLIEAWGIAQMNQVLDDIVSGTSSI